MERSWGRKLGVTGSHFVSLLTSGVTFPVSLFLYVCVGGRGDKVDLFTGVRSKSDLPISVPATRILLHR